MRVLIANNLYPPKVTGGAERSVALLAESLAQRGATVTVLTLGEHAENRQFQSKGVNVEVLPLRNLYWPFDGHRPHRMKPLWHLADTYNPLMMELVDRASGRARPDVIHTNNLTGFSVAVWRTAQRRRTPVVHTLRDYYLLCPRTTMFRRNRNCATQCGACRVYAFARRRMSTIVNAVIGISDHILNVHLAAGYFPNASIKTTISNSIAPTSGQSTRVRAEPGTVRLGYLGRLHPSKGIELLLAEVGRLQRDNWRLAIAGSGPPDYVAALKSRSALDPRIEFLGWQDAETFLSGIDVLIVPSLWHEPFGRTIVEGLAHRVPVIASTRGGIPELIRDGEDGWLFDPDLPGTLEAVLSTILEQPDVLERMGERAAESAQKFHPDEIAAQYQSIYRSVIKQQAAGETGVPDRHIRPAT